MTEPVSDYRIFTHPFLKLGTCSWSTRDWVNRLYPADAPQREYIAHYARYFDAVEVDATFYGTPRRQVLEGWRERTPEDFSFAVKAPQVITHERFLENCGEELKAFLTAMDLLGGRLGPVLFQFPYFSRKKGVTQRDFVERLAAFLPLLPKGRLFAVEVRNKGWLTPRLLDMLRQHNVATTLIDHPWMAPPDDLFDRDGIVTGPFVYVRWLGDRYGIQRITTVWSDHVLDREDDMRRWVPGIRGLLDMRVQVYGFVNSHYSGYAPGDAARFQRLLNED